MIKLCNILKVEPIDLIRRSDTAYKNLNIPFENEKNKNAVFDVIIKNPKVLQRPIIINGQIAVIGRPPEKIYTILSFSKKPNSFV